MAKFKVAVSWSMCTDLTIDADTLDEAKKIAQDALIPDDGVYIDDSWEINEGVTDLINGSNADNN